MNVERLHRILIDIDEEIESNNLNGMLTNLQNHLQNQINSPQDVNNQNLLAKTRRELSDYLENSEYNNYSPSWKQVLNEIGGRNLFGIELKDSMDEIFSRNQITIATALEEIKGIVSTFINLRNAIKQTLKGLEGLNIGSEELEEGDCELGYTIPRLFVENRLEGLEEEIHELNFILNTLSEAVTGKKEDYKVKTISSSDFLLYLFIGLNVANVLAKSTERILNIYKQILEIKALRNQLQSKGVPEKETIGIESHANKLMEQEIKKIAKEVIDEHYNGDTGRKNELQNGLIFALNKLANRIDNGFNVEIRIEPISEVDLEEDDEEDNPETKKRNDLIKSISESSNKIEYIKTEGKSILKLPEERKNK